ncbi:MAG: flagellar motor protein MotB [Gammaproteobacteria bacterium]|nr:flagellar motor protein MotB [Gammaproteobacteria bacterium]
MNDNQPIIKKITKRNHAGHHGGSWKVAYADFVTAMMAFFLLMWLLGSTDEEQKAQLSDFFENPTVFLENKESGGASIIDFGERGKSGVNIKIEEVSSSQEADQTAELSERELDKLLQEREQRELASLKELIEKSIEESMILSDFKEQLKLDVTNEGLRIQIIDQDSKPMFDVGSSHLKDYADDILFEISQLLIQVPNRISISGHTDATPYSDNNSNYSNWELSSDRANSARRTFIDSGMDENKIGRIIGLASSVLYDQSDPNSPINRRISIVVLNKKTAHDIGLDEEPMALEKKLKPEEETEQPVDLIPLW